MAYQINPERLYMMPTHFGPTPGPRQTDTGGRHLAGTPTRYDRYAVPFITRADQLEALLPPGFVLEGDPVVTVEFTYMTNIAWLAGRGYNTVGVRFPAQYRGERDQVSGQFLTVLWENMTDPIITGREQLGVPKIFADIEGPRTHGENVTAGASWGGFEFLRFKQAGTQQLSSQEMEQILTSMPLGEGILHYKYQPATGEPWREADAEYATLMPFATEPGIDMTFQEMCICEGELQFNRPTWEQMPTQNHIVGALCDLEVLEYQPSYRLVFESNDDLRGLRRLK